MTGSGLLLEVTAPTAPESFDRFVARAPAFAAAWATWALTARGFSATQKLVDLALAGRLIIRVTAFEGERLGAPLDLSRWVTLELDGAPPVRLSSSKATAPRGASSQMAALQRRLELRPDEGIELSVDARGMADALPAPAPPVLEHGAMVLFAGLPALHVGANLVDAAEVAEDPDPPPERVVELPASTAPLFEAIYADPESNALREVLADALEEANHPRGRFMRLQLTAPGSREEQVLLERHEQAWLGDLTRLLSAVVWERGFPIEGTIREHLPGLLERRELRTLERLHFNESNRLGKPTSLTVLERLTHATHVGLAAIPALIEGRFERLRALHCRTFGLIDFGVPAPELLSLTSTTGLPALKWFELDDGILEGQNGGRLTGGPGRFLDASDFAWLWPTPLGRRLECFGTRVKLDALASWLKLAAALPVPVVLLRVCQYLDFESLWLRLERGSTVLQARWRQVPEGYDDHRPTTQLLLEAMEGSPFTRVRLEHARPGPDDRRWVGPRLELVMPGPLEPFLSLGSRSRKAD